MAEYSFTLDLSTSELVCMALDLSRLVPDLFLQTVLAFECCESRIRAY